VRRGSTPRDRSDGATRCDRGRALLVMEWLAGRTSGAEARHLDRERDVRWHAKSSRRLAAGTRFVAACDRVISQALDLFPCGQGRRGVKSSTRDRLSWAALPHDKTGALIGTLGTCAEQRRGERGRCGGEVSLTPAADIFSAGMCDCFEALAGARVRGPETP